jgi:predicted outer membrane lipoprotein
MALDTRGWLDRYAAALDLPPIAQEEVETLLALAGVAAHASERTAAPITCYLAALSGVALADAFAVANDLAAELAGTADPQDGG